MLKLLALFVLLPLLELALLIEIGSRMGTLATVGLIVFTGVLGATLARVEGLGVMDTIRDDLAAGRLPADGLLDGAMILVAGAVLMTPGVLTDAAGFLLLVPAFRRWLKARVRRRLERAVSEGRAHVSFHVGGHEPPTDPDPADRVIDVEGVSVESEEAG